MWFKTSKSLRAVAVIALVIGLMAANTATSSAQTSGWSTPKLLSNPNVRSWFPDVMADATGRVHVLWSSGIRDRSVWDTVVYATSTDGVIWTPGVDIAATDPFGTALGQRAPAATRPVMVMDLNGNVHVSFRDDQSLYYAHTPIQDFGQPDSLNPVKVANGDVPYFAEMAVDSKGVIHYLFTENVRSDNCGICYQLFYRNSANLGKTWSPIISISDPEIGAAKPTIVVDKEDNLHVVWEAGAGGSLGNVLDPTRVVYAASYDGGKTWQPPVTLPSNQVGQQAKFITIGVDGQDHLVTAWLSQPRDEVFYQISTDAGRQWSAPQQIQGIFAPEGILYSRLSTFSMATDSAGNVHLVLIGRTDLERNNTNVLHIMWNGTAWSQPEVIATEEKNTFEWPSIAIGLGNQIHITWFQRDEAHIFDPDQGLYSIWYARGSAPAPTMTPMVYPTPTALPAPTATPLPVNVVATPLPVDPNFTDVTMSQLIGEGQSLGIIALASLPVILIAITAFLLRRRS
jgi:hypothetical protein